MKKEMEENVNTTRKFASLIPGLVKERLKALKSRITEVLRE